MPGFGERTLGEDRDAEIARALARALGWPYVDLGEYSISCGILRQIPAELCRRMRCVPIVFNARRIVLVVDDPFQGLYLSCQPELFDMSRWRDVELSLTTPLALDAALHRRIAVVKD